MSRQHGTTKCGYSVRDDKVAERDPAQPYCHRASCHMLLARDQRRGCSLL